MAKKSKPNPRRDDLAQRMAEMAAHEFILMMHLDWEPHHLECEIRDRLAACNLVPRFQELLREYLTKPGEVPLEAPPAKTTAIDTAGEIVAALGEAGAAGWDAPLCTLTSDPQMAIVKMQMGNGSSSLKRNGIHTPVPVQEAAAYIRRVVQAVG